MTDKILFTAVQKILNAVIENHDLINSDVPETSYTPNQAVIRQQNEIRRMMQNPSVDYESVKAEAYQLAGMKYACCEYSDAPRKTAELKNILAEKEKSDTLDIDLLKSCVRRILVSHFYTIEVEFINGVIISERREQT